LSFFVAGSAAIMPAAAQANISTGWRALKPEH
jgi:hypothetical protein